MKCSSCNQELNFPKEILKKFTNCPLCGAPMPKVGGNAPVSIEMELRKIVDDFGGLEILSEENYSRFSRALAAIDTNFAEERDKLLVANIKKIPQKMYSVIEFPQKEKQQVVDSCIEELTSFGLQKKLIDEIISWLAQLMNFSVILEQKPVVEKRMGEPIIIKAPNLFGKEKLFECDPINTCFINDQIWASKNIFLDCDTFDPYHYEQHDAINPLSGSIFKGPWFFSYLHFPNEGWRLPTIEDFKSLEEYIVSLGLTVGEALKGPKLWHGHGRKGIDLFGFEAYPAARGDNGVTKVSFWADRGIDVRIKGAGYSESHNYSLVTLDADSDNFQYEDIVKYHNKFGCVRFVRDAFNSQTSSTEKKDFAEESERKQEEIINSDKESEKFIDDQDIKHWKEDKFFKNVYSSEQFKNADLESKEEMRRAAKEEAKMIKALRRDAGLGGGCYITTAICEASGKSDDCHELTMMRKFRDEWLAKQPDGYYLIYDYYETAPKIVAAIDSLQERRFIYDFLNCNFLKKCVDFAGRDLMNDCKKCYMDMVRYCSRFLKK